MTAPELQINLGTLVQNHNGFVATDKKQSIRYTAFIDSDPHIRRHKYRWMLSKYQLHLSLLHDMTENVRWLDIINAP